MRAYWVRRLKSAGWTPKSPSPATSCARSSVTALFARMRPGSPSPNAGSGPRGNPPELSRRRGGRPRWVGAGPSTHAAPLLRIRACQPRLRPTIDPRLPRPTAPKHTVHFIETSQGTLEYVVIGEGEPILTIHGAAGGFDQGIDITGPMAEQSYRLIAPSRFGYLRSTLPANPTTALKADAYVELLDRLGINKVALSASLPGHGRQSSSPSVIRNVVGRSCFWFPRITCRRARPFAAAP
jgi:hypothetical protein